MSERMVDLLEQVWADIDALVADLPEPDWARDTDCPGWSVQDNVAHMIGTERMLLGEQPPKMPDDLARPHVKNPIGAANEGWIVALADLSPTEVLAQFREVTGRRIDALRAMSTEDFDKVGFTPEGEGPYRLFMEIRVFDCWVHEQDIRRAVSRPGGFESDVAALSVGRIRNGMPYVVGKKAAAPQGATVVFDVAGPPAQNFAVGVDGRAAVLDEVPGDPSVILAMNAETYAALACGRWGPDRAADDVTITGEADLGRRIIADMSFTI